MSNLNYVLLDENDAHPSQHLDSSENNLCVICYDNLEQPDKVPFSIPECNHTFHQTCINSWFRQGNQKCPLCNDLGCVSQARHRSYYGSLHRFTMLRRMSKKKYAPTFLVKEMTKFKNRENNAKKSKQDFKEWKNREVTFEGEKTTINAIAREFDKRRISCRRKDWNIRRLKRAISEKLNIIPLILVEKKIIK